MHPLDNTTRFFAVVGAPYIPEAHLDDRCDDSRRHSCAAGAEHEHPQAADVTAWWPRIRH